MQLIKSAYGLLFLWISTVIFVMSYSTTVFSACNSSMPVSTPTARFSLHADATVTDNVTGLMWARCSLGQTFSAGACTGVITRVNWQDALSLASGATEASYLNWRLPNVKELQSIVEASCYNPSINPTVFPDALSFLYATSTPSISDIDSSWSVDFRNGRIAKGLRQEISGFEMAIRLVRNDLN